MAAIAIAATSTARPATMTFTSPLVAILASATVLPSSTTLFPRNTPLPQPTSTPLPSGCNKQGRPVQGFDVDGEFYFFWCTNGGGKVFGDPIGPLVNDASRYDGVSRYQWFSKARVERHPSMAATVRQRWAQ